jgi:hypothetical protein
MPILSVCSPLLAKPLTELVIDRTFGVVGILQDSFHLAFSLIAANCSTSRSFSARMAWI